MTAEPLFTRSLDVLQAYTDWLLSQVSRVRVIKQGQEYTCQGWQSEHTYQPKVIHVWATSQAVLFLQHFSAMLQQHVARAARNAGGLDFRPRKGDSAAERAVAWRDKIDKHEPMKGLKPDSPFRGYNRVDTAFVQPRLAPSASTPPGWSILLYGPPGTGKTSFARATARALGYDLIIVSPSDFIRGGEADVEARAKRLFDVLGAQSNVVILFDEIDRLILDRDSDAYHAQADMFQFMTPSMLTKINDLHEQERSIFIIATNYEERIDNAIRLRPAEWCMSRT